MKKFYLTSAIVPVGALLPLAFMSDAVRTVTVKGVRMNLSDYDEKLHGPVDEGSDAENGDCPLETLTREQEEKAREQRMKDYEAQKENALDKQIATDPTAQMTTGDVDGRTPEQREMHERISSINFGAVADGRKHFVVDMNDIDPDSKAARRVTNLPGIDEKGYASLQKAWDAIIAVKSQLTGANVVGGTTADPDADKGDGEGGDASGDGDGNSE